MTTIAYRDGLLASDTLITERDRRMGYVDKVFRHQTARGIVLWGVCGTLIDFRIVHDWIIGGLRGQVPSMCTPHGADSTAILIADGKLLTLDKHGVDWMALPEFTAIGSGTPYAMGAFAHGASAPEAVAASIKIDIHSGGGIRVVSL